MREPGPQFEYRLDLATRGRLIVHEHVTDRADALSTAQTAANTLGIVVKVWCRPVGGRDIDWAIIGESSPA